MRTLLLASVFTALALPALAGAGHHQPPAEPAPPVVSAPPVNIPQVNAPSVTNNPTANSSSSSHSQAVATSQSRASAVGIGQGGNSVGVGQGGTGIGGTGVGGTGGTASGGQGGSATVNMNSPSSVTVRNVPNSTLALATAYCQNNAGVSGSGVGFGFSAAFGRHDIDCRRLNFALILHSMGYDAQAIHVLMNNSEVKAAFDATPSTQPTTQPVASAQPAPKKRSFCESMEGESETDRLMRTMNEICR